VGTDREYTGEEGQSDEVDREPGGRRPASEGTADEEGEPGGVGAPPVCDEGNALVVVGKRCQPEDDGARGDRVGRLPGQQEPEPDRRVDEQRNAVVAGTVHRSRWSGVGI